MTQDVAGPVFFPISVARLPKNGMPVLIEATPEQRAALAEVHDLREVTWYRAEMDVVGWKKGGVKVTGRVLADIVQSCIVTLEPVKDRIDEEFSALFLPEGSRLAVPRQSAEGEILLDAEGDDGPELFSGDTIDVGAVAEEFFALGINLYPRKGGVQMNASDDAEEEKRGPLAEKLEALRKKL